MLKKRNPALAVSVALAIGLIAPVTTAALAMPPADAWEIGPWARGKNFSVNMPATPRENARGALVVDFPRVGRGEWDAMTTGIYPLADTKRIKVRYRIDAAPGTRFVAVEDPDSPATVSLYFQRARDTWTAKGKYMSYRWYAPKRAVMPITPGEHTVSIRMDEEWTNIAHRPRSEHRTAFDAALADTARFGFAFGSMSLRSHGVAATGPATFTLLSVEFD